MSEAIKLLDRILFYSRKKGDCLVCYSDLDRDGYSRISVNFGSKINRAHRTSRIIMHLLKDFPLDSVLQIHHNDSICKSRACIEFDHLSIGDAKENASTRKEYFNNRKQGSLICEKHNINKSLNSARRLVCHICHREAQRKHNKKQNQTKHQNKTTNQNQTKREQTK